MTNLFPTKNELIRIHETDFKTIKRLPDFDVDTVVVALQKIGQFELIIEVITLVGRVGRSLVFSYPETLGCDVILYAVVVYFHQRLGAVPLNAGQNQSKMPHNARISLKYAG